MMVNDGQFMVIEFMIGVIVDNDADGWLISLSGIVRDLCP